MSLKQVLPLAVLLAGLLICAVSPAGLLASEEESVTAERLFARAETLYRQLDTVDPQGRDVRAWGSLALAFGEVPERFPTSTLAGNALWRIGDIHSRQLASGVEAARPRAHKAYAALVNRYPSNSYAPSAYLRLAELASGGESQAYYYRLLQRHPDSQQAGVARERLAHNDTPVAVADGKRVSDAPVAAASTGTDGAGSSGAFDFDDQPLDAVLEAAPTPASRTASGHGSASGHVSAPGGASPSGDLSAVAAEDGIGHVLGVRFYSDETNTRVVFDLDRPIQHQIGEAQSPSRLFVDLVGAELAANLPRTFDVGGRGVRQVRLALNRPGVVRIVVDLQSDAPYSFFRLSEPARLVVDVPGRGMADKLTHARRPAAPEGGSEARHLNLGVRRIVIDPGHGGTAPGAIGRSGVTEKELVLDISRRLAENLRRSDYEVILTRDSDRSLDLEERPGLATSAAADLFVSIHINSANSEKLSGFETYYLDLATDPTAAETAARENSQASGGVGNLDEVLDDIVKNANKRESRDLAHSIQDSLVLQINKNYDKVRDLGVKHAPFIVLVGAEMPAVLIECSFVSNPTEEERLRDPAYRQQIADAIHIGIDNYAAKRRMLTTAR